MLNLIIYLKSQTDAKDLIKKLIFEQLIANASIDFNNKIYRLEGNELISNSITVITAQTKSILFSQIEKFIATHYGEDIPIYSTPIMQANQSFDHLIRTTTLVV
jgi:uncharacterized protein involved in tolerance to divalent cations